MDSTFAAMSYSDQPFAESAVPETYRAPEVGLGEISSMPVFWTARLASTNPKYAIRPAISKPFLRGQRVEIKNRNWRSILRPGRALGKVGQRSTTFDLRAAVGLCEVGDEMSEQRPAGCWDWHDRRTAIEHAETSGMRSCEGSWKDWPRKECGSGIGRLTAMLVREGMSSITGGYTGCIARKAWR